MRALDPRLLRRGRAVRRLLVADAALGIVAALLVLAQAALLAHVAVRGAGGASVGAVVLPLGLLLAVIAARAAAAWGFEVVGRRAAADVVSYLRLDVVERRLADPVAADRAESGELATAAVGGVDALEALFARYLPQLALAIVVPVVVLAVVASIDLVSAGIMLLTLPLVPVFMWLVGRYSERRTRERWQALALLANHFLDVVRGLPTLRAFNRGRAQATQVALIGDRYRRATMQTLRITFLSGAVLELAATLGVALVAVTVGVRLVGGEIGFEPALVVLVLAPELYQPLRRLGAEYHASADGIAVAERLLAEIDRPASGVTGTAAPPSPLDGPIRLERVSFAYGGRSAAALNRASLQLLPGEMVALVGQTGSGKSTLAALLLGLADPDAGRVTVAGVDLRDCDRGRWRAHTAWVPQRPTLLRASVAENIRLGDPAASEARVRAAAAAAGADAFIRALPLGYATIVGDGGRQLSAGERQRIALARAFLRDAPLLVLDEPTANLDSASAEAVVDAIERLSDARTVLLIAHRLELAAAADRVVRLEAGRVLERELMAA